MLRSAALETRIKKRLAYILSQKQLINDLKNYLEEKYDYPPIEYMQYMLGARPLEFLEDEHYFWLIDGINNLNVSEKIRLDQYFSDIEMRTYSVSKYTEPVIEKYPIVFKVIEVTDDRWSTKIDVQTLKDLYDKQLIIYNPNTQRQLKKTSYGGVDYYTIDIVSKSIKEIESLLEKGEFISNDLSFNLSIDNPNIEFDIKGDELIVTSGEFDIIDGFHRFRAAMNVINRNPDFNFTFGLRIMNYNESKANAYIGQEDKRNQISLIHRKSLDSTNATNIVIERLSNTSNSRLKCMIGTEGIALISRAYLFGLIDYYYKTSQASRSELSKISNKLIGIFNSIIDDIPEYENGINNTDLAVIIYGSMLEDDPVLKIEEVLKKKDKPKIKKRINKSNLESIEKLYE